MKKHILKDKLSKPIFLTIIISFVSLKDGDGMWLYIIIAFLLFFTFSIFKSDLYLVNYKLENKKFVIKCLKNFYNNTSETISINSNSVKSFKIYSDEGFREFYTIAIFFLDDEDLNDKKTIKTKSKETFINLLYELQKAEKGNTIEETNT